MQKLLLLVFLAGVRDDSYDAKDGTRKERYLADLYLPGAGAFSIPLTRQVYDVLVNVPPMSGQYELPVSIEIEDRIQKAANSNFQYVRRELALRYGDLTPAAQAKKAG